MADDTTKEAPKPLSVADAIAQASAAQAERAGTDTAEGPDGLPETFSDEDLAFLTEAERKDIMADPDRYKAAPAEGDDPDEDDDDDEGEDGKAEKGGAKPGDTADQIAAAAAAEQEQKDQQQKQERAKLEVPDVSKEQEKLKENEAARDKLVNDFDSGEIDIKTFREKDKALIAEADDLKGKIRVAEDRQTINAKSDAEVWYDAVDSYTAAYPELVKKDGQFMPRFDKELRSINSDPDLLRLPAAERIAMAHRRTIDWASTAKIEGRDAIALKDQKKKGDGKKDELKARTDKRDDIPPALAHVPQTDVSEAAEGRFAQIDRAIDEDPYEGERAVASMSGPELERYLAMQD